MLLSYLADSATFFSFTQCSKDLIFLWEQHVLFSSGKINISECVLLSHWYCKYWNSELFSKTIYCPFNWKTLFFTWSLYYDPFLLFPLIKTWKCYLILHVTSQWTAFSSLNINHEHQPKYFFFLKWDPMIVYQWGLTFAVINWSILCIIQSNTYLFSQSLKRHYGVCVCVWLCFVCVYHLLHAEAQHVSRRWDSVLGGFQVSQGQLFTGNDVVPN